MRALAGRDTEVIDAAGMTVTPGFIDAHCHPGLQDELYDVNCDLPGIAQIQAALRKRAAETAPGHWVRGFKFDDTKLKEWAANHLWLAQRAGGASLHGVELTSRVVFGKEAQDLTTAEQYVLASAVNKPIILQEGSEQLNKVRLDHWHYIAEVRAKKCADALITDADEQKKVVFELVNMAVMQLLLAGPRYNWGYQAVWAYDPIPAITGLRCPVLLLWGEHDRLVPPAFGREYAKHLPQAKWQTIPGAGHLAMFEREAEFVEAVRAFALEEGGGPA